MGSGAGMAFTGTCGSTYTQLACQEAEMSNYGRRSGSAALAGLWACLANEDGSPSS